MVLMKGDLKHETGRVYCVIFNRDHNLFVTLTKVLLLSKCNQKQDSGHKSWYPVSNSCDLYALHPQTVKTNLYYINVISRKLG